MRRIKDYGPSLIVLATTVTVLLAGPQAVRSISFAYTDTRIVQASQRLEDNPILEQISQAYRDLAMVVEPSVVHVSTEQVYRDRWGEEARKASSGSGWMYDDDGHVVTNHHVIEDADRIEVQLHDGRTHAAQIVGSDPLTDIAVLKIESSSLHPAAQRRMEDGTIEQGDLVFAFGSPFDFRFSMSSGVVSGKGRSVNVIRDDRGRLGYEYFIQVDAAINPGNSGGPLTDSRGRVIGMNTAIATGRRSGPNLEDGQFAGIGLAIPIEMIEPVVRQLIDKGQVDKGYLGLTVVDRENVVGDELQMLQFRGGGLLVGAIGGNHPAFGAGLRVGDVITGFEGQRVVDRSDVLGMLDGYTGTELVTLNAYAIDADGARLDRRDINVPASALRGLRDLTLLEVDDSVGKLFDSLGFPAMGVRVARLTDEGPAREAGLHRGDIIIDVNGSEMTSVQQLRSVISTMQPGQIARVQVWRFDPERQSGRNLVIEVPLGRLDTLQAMGRLPEGRLDAIPEVGIRRMETSSRELARSRGVEFHPGVLILEIVPGSRLATELPVGSTIVEVMEQPIESTDELSRALRQQNLLPPYGARVTAILPDGEVKQLRLQAGQ